MSNNSFGGNRLQKMGISTQSKNQRRNHNHPIIIIIITSMSGIIHNFSPLCETRRQTQVRRLSRLLSAGAAAHKTSEPLIGYVDSYYPHNTVSRAPQDRPTDGTPGGDHIQGTTLQTFEFAWSNSNSTSSACQGVLLHPSLIGRIVREVLATSRTRAADPHKRCNGRSGQESCKSHTECKTLRGVQTSILHGLPVPRNRIEHLLHHSYNIVDRDGCMRRCPARSSRTSTLVNMDCKYKNRLRHRIRLDIESTESTFLFPLRDKQESATRARAAEDRRSFLKVSRLDTVINEHWDIEETGETVDGGGSC